MAIPAQLERRLELGNRRYSPRRSLRLGTVIEGTVEHATIHDLSVTGLLLETSGDLLCGERLLVDIPERGPTSATVIWTSGNFFGCEFEVSSPLHR